MTMEAVAIVATGLFAGSALGVSINEYPGFEGLDVQAARKQFTVTFKGIATSQVLTALVSSGSALLLASQKSSDDAKTIYLAGGLAMLGMLPYTVLCIMPTNKQLMSAEKKEDAQVKKLLEKWAKLHAVRTVVSIATFAGLTYAAVCMKK